VSDVKNYKKFVPFCTKSIILSQGPHELRANLEVGFPPIIENYTSVVSLAKPKLVQAVCRDGKLFSFMETTWKFNPGLKSNPQSAIIDFYIDFEFKSLFYSQVSALFFDQLVQQMEKAFIQEAQRRFVLPAVNRRLVSTSKKSNDTAVADAIKTETKKVEHKNWVNYGFDTKSKDADRTALHSIMFASVTLCLVVGGYYITYLPDYNLRDWSQREAFLELRRREKLGLPLVDPNLIDPAKVTLPSDEELGDTEIII
ncbi:NADH dehydrogenase [ubiquinone] 1 beta subcomplex subunit 11, mitochondrial, partial [Asbolus verrucosus]